MLHPALEKARAAPGWFQRTRILFYLYLYIVFAFETSNCVSIDVNSEITSTSAICWASLGLLGRLGFLGQVTSPNGGILSKFLSPLYSHLLAWGFGQGVGSLGRRLALPRTLSRSSRKFASVRYSIKEFSRGNAPLFLVLTVQSRRFCPPFSIVKNSARIKLFRIPQHSGRLSHCHRAGSRA